MSLPEKAGLQQEYSQLRPLELSRHIGRLQDRLLAMVSGKGVPAPESQAASL